MQPRATMRTLCEFQLVHAAARQRCQPPRQCRLGDTSWSNAVSHRDNARSASGMPCCSATVTKQAWRCCREAMLPPTVTMRTLCQCRLAHAAGRHCCQLLRQSRVAMMPETRCATHSDNADIVSMAACPCYRETMLSVTAAKPACPSCREAMLSATAAYCGKPACQDYPEAILPSTVTMRILCKCHLAHGAARQCFFCQPPRQSRLSDAADRRCCRPQ